MGQVNALYGSTSARRATIPRRVAVISVHTSPLDQPGAGDAGGMNVYVVEVCRRLAEAGVEVEIFTRATSRDLPPVLEMAPGVLVNHIVSGPMEGLRKEDLPGELCGFTTGLLRAEASRPSGWYDLVHSHYWLSGQVGGVARDRWGVPLVHTAHTLAKVKNQNLRAGETPEPRVRVVGEEQIVDEADQLVVNTPVEAGELVRLYGADARKVSVVPPGVDLERFCPDPSGRDRARLGLGLPTDALVVAMVGRVQPLKGPDVLIRAAAQIVRARPDVGRRLAVVICGGVSGAGAGYMGQLVDLVSREGLAGVVRFLPPRSWEDLAEVYRAADLVAVPSHSESFGLVALEAQACGTPVVAAAVGGLKSAVRDGVSGRLAVGHDPHRWGTLLGDLLASPRERARLSAGAVAHARGYSWNATASGMLEVYRGALTRHRFERVALCGCRQ